jgi:hypothetical protein
LKNALSPSRVEGARWTSRVSREHQGGFLHSLPIKQILILTPFKIIVKKSYQTIKKKINVFQSKKSVFYAKNFHKIGNGTALERPEIRRQSSR